MAPRAKSPYGHGPSEIWGRPAVTRAAAALRQQMAGRLRQLRLEKNLSQEKAAELVGLHPKHLQRLEAGTANVTITTLAAVALAYGVAVQALFEPGKPAARKRAPRKTLRAARKR